MRVCWKKVIIVCLDVLLAVYIVIAFTSFGQPSEANVVCRKPYILIEDSTTNGFLDVHEIQTRLEKAHLDPDGVPFNKVDCRRIEDMLKQSAFVKTAQCYKTQNGNVFIELTQRLPVVRIKNITGDDYYVDDHNQVMPNSHYTSDMIIATGYISRWYAERYIAPMAKVIMANALWRNLIEQINVLPDRGIEIVPRIGDHIVYLGNLPESKYFKERDEEIRNFVTRKLDRLIKFYRYGLSQAGWNKYSYISLEFDNQIICKRRHTENEVASAESQPVATPQQKNPLQRQQEAEKTEKQLENTEPTE
ncbi:MAG: cell division protein FtsQ [Prevotella sp.]|nr:cell division protein FtsQ [Prevotella sp.]